MTSPHVDGAHPRRALGSMPGSVSASGSAPHARAGQAAARMAERFELQMQQSMQSSLAASDARSSSEEDDGGDPMAGIVDASQQELIGALLAGASRPGASPAKLQALLSAMGTGSLTTSGAGSEAKLAQQLIAELDGSAGAAEASGTVSSAPAGDARENARTVATVAREHGVDPTVAVAMMLVESGGRANAVGDGGTSFGLFQLHEGGMLTAAGLTANQAFDPRTNAAVALKSYAHEHAKGHARRSAGEIAAASQRPADPVGYAAKVDAMLERARALLA